MAFDHHKQIQKLVELSSKESLVLRVLADHANHHTKKCCPTWETITRESGLSRASVHRALVLLRDKGYVTPTKSDRKVQYNLELTNPKPPQVAIELKVAAVEQRLIGGVSKGAVTSQLETCRVSPGELPILNLKDNKKEILGKQVCSSQAHKKSEEKIMKFPEGTSSSDVLGLVEKLKNQKKKKTSQVGEIHTPLNFSLAKADLLWRNHIPKIYPQITMVCLTVKQKGQLKYLLTLFTQGHLEEDYALTTIIEKWVEFCIYLKGHFNVFYSPALPDMGFLLKNGANAVNFIIQYQNATVAPVQLIAQKPFKVTMKEIIPITLPPAEDSVTLEDIFKWEKLQSKAG
jgi:predicted transcriptional regulator